MTTTTELREDLRAFREEDQAAHAEIIEHLKHTNGTLGEHSVAIAEIRTEQGHHGEKIAKAESERGTLFKLVRALSNSNAKTAGAVAVVFILLQWLIGPLLAPFIARIFGG